jgi:PAS domain S-box-containing protein
MLTLMFQFGSRKLIYVVAAVCTGLFAWICFATSSPLTIQTSCGRAIWVVVLWLPAIFLGERIRQEKKLLAEAQLHDNVLTDQWDAVLRFKVDGSIIYANDYFCRYFGKRREEWIGARWDRIFMPEDLSEVENSLRKLSPTNQVIILENRVHDHAGEKRWMQFINRGVFNPAGELTEVQSVGRDVTDRRRSEELLRESEQRFRELEENIQDVFWLYDVIRERIVYISPKYDKVWGRAAEALLVDPYDWAEAIHPEDRLRVLAAVEKQKEGNYDEEFRIVMPDGRICWTRGRAFPVRDASGRVVRIAGVHRDITRRKQFSEAYQRTQEIYRKLAESSPDAIFIFDRDLKIVYANRSAGDRLGKLPAEMPGHGCADFFPAEIAQEYEASLRRVLDSGAPLQRERRTVMRGGERIIETRLLPLTGQLGEVTSVMGISRDMTELRRAEASLRESEEWSRKLIRNMSEGFFRVDRSGWIRETNDAYCRMSGYSREELMQMRISDISLKDTTPEEVCRRIDRAIQLGNDSFETRHRRKDGTVMHVETVLTALQLPEPQIMTLMRDITGRKQLEQEVMRISSHERQRIGFDLHDGLGQHLAGMAFKLKVLADGLVAASSPESVIARQLVVLVNEAIGQTRSLARALAPVEVEMSGLAPALKNLARESEQKFQVECRCEMAAASDKIHMEVATAFYRVAQEAIHNAIRHGRATVIQIDLECDSRGGLCLIINDNGQGFEDQPVAPGGGMGLRIMRYRAEAVGGRLLISSKKGGGTKVSCIVGLSENNGVSRFIT